MLSLLLSIVAALCGMCTPSQSQSFDLNPTSTRALSRVKHVCTTAACGDVSKPLSLLIRSSIKSQAFAPPSTVSIVETNTNTYEDLDDTKDVANLRAKCKSDVCEAAEECTLAPKFSLSERSAAAIEQSSSISRSDFKTISSTAVSQVADGGGFLTVSGRGKGRGTKTGTSGHKKKNGAKTPMNKNKKEKKNSAFGTINELMHSLDGGWEEGKSRAYSWNRFLTDKTNHVRARRHYAHLGTSYCSTCGGAGRVHTKSSKTKCSDCVRISDKTKRSKDSYKKVAKKALDKRVALLTPEEIESAKKERSVYDKEYRKTYTGPEGYDTLADYSKEWRKTYTGPEEFDTLSDYQKWYRETNAVDIAAYKKNWCKNKYVKFSIILLISLLY